MSTAFKPRVRVFIDSRNQQFVDRLIRRLTSEDVLLFYDVEISCSDFSLENGLTKDFVNRSSYELYLAEATRECDVFVYDLNSSIHSHFQTLLKILKNFPLQDTKKKLVLISNILTWEFAEKLFEADNEDNEKSFVSGQQDTEDGEQTNEEAVEEKEENEEDDFAVDLSEEEDKEDDKKETEPADDAKPQDKKQLYFSEKDCLRRMGKGKYLRMIGLENLALNLKKSNSNLAVTILCPGVIYGEEEQGLGQLFKISWLQNPEVLQILGKGTNEIPMIHYNDFLTFVKFSVLENTDRHEYVFVVDRNRKRLQRQIIKSIAKGVNKGLTTKVSSEDSLYEKKLKRVLSLDVKWKYPNIIKNHVKKLRELQEKEEKERQQQTNEADEDNEGVDIDVPPAQKLPSRSILDYRLIYETGFVKNITQIKDEFIKASSLSQIKVCVVGGPYVGKTHIAKRLAQNYNIPYINADQLVQYFIGLKDSFSEEITSYLEQKREELFTKTTEDYEKRKKQGKVVDKTLPVKEDLYVTVSDKMLIKMLKTRLNMNDCINRGYVIDGFPNSHQTASKLFKCKIIRPQGES
jgi:adenylate kinase family enzyme